MNGTNENLKVSVNTVQEERELDIEELGEVSGGYINPLTQDDLDALMGGRGSTPMYNEFMEEAGKYVAELGLGFRLSNDEAQAQFLQYVYPKMLTFCRSNPHFQHFTDTDVYNLVACLSRFMYYYYCKAYSA